MKKMSYLILPALCIALITPALLFSAPVIKEIEKGKTWHVSIDALPATLDQFRTLRDAIAGTPQGGIALYLIAHLIMAENPQLGEQCLIISLDMSQLGKKGAGSRGADVDGWQIGSSEKMKMNTTGFLRGKSYIASSYISGTSTSAGYVRPQLPWTFVIQAHKFQDANPDIWKGLASTSCNDSGYAPIHVKKNNRGVWKVVNSSSFYSGCKPPAKVEDDAL
jgi:hypothetical protein